MTTTSLTAKFVEKVKPPSGGRIEHWDRLLPGFGLRVTPTGNKSWVLMYRQHGRQRRMTIGKYPALTLEKARGVARTALEDVAKGSDPADNKKAARERRLDDLGAVAELFVEKHAKPNNKSWKNQARRLEMHVTPHWGRRPIDTITKRDVVLLLEKIAEQSGPYVAEDTLKVVRKMFNWAADRDIVEVNPAQHVKPPRKTGARDRVLSDSELKAVWTAAGALGYPFGPFVHTLILTGQRRTEVATLRWDEIEGDIWTIPAGKTKSSREHLVPLSYMVREIIGQRSSQKGPFVFSTTNGEKPISGFNKPKACLEVTLAGEVEDWRFHDLRRTCATGLARLGFPDEVIARILNHSTRGVTSIYNRHAYLSEKRYALEQWCATFEEP